MEHAKLHNILGILLLLDFRRAFDTIEWSFIQNSDSIKRWVSMFYTGPDSAVLNNGFCFTNYFQLLHVRGARQGFLCHLIFSS